MSQETIQIKSRKLGQSLNSLRKKGLVPGVLYGQSMKESLPIEINVKDLQKIVNNKTHTTTFFLNYEGKEHECILREYQTDRLHTQFLHVDFQYVKEDEIVKIQVPVAYEGLEFLSSKKLILEKSIPQLPVVGPIQDLPKAFLINIGELNKGAKILANQVTLPPHIQLLMNPETIIATVQ